MKKFLLALILPIFLFTSCEFLESGLVLAPESAVQENAVVEVVPDSMLPDKVTAIFEGEKVVLVHKEDLKTPESPHVPVTSDPMESVEGILGVVGGVLGTYFPALAGLEGILLMLSKRRRKHYGNAVKAALPTNGSVELGEAIKNLGKAVGVLHSSEKTEEVFEKEKK